MNEVTGRSTESPRRALDGRPPVSDGPFVDGVHLYHAGTFADVRLEGSFRSFKARRRVKSVTSSCTIQDWSKQDKTSGKGRLGRQSESRERA
jgi:hypothetical protein